MTTIATHLPVTVAAAKGGYRAARLQEILEAARAALTNRVKKGTALTSPRLIRDYLMTRLSARDHEVFTVPFLGNWHRVIECVDLFRGTIDGASVHPREMVKEALQRDAAAVIQSHNHPSGVSEPSHVGELIMQRLREALALVEIRVLDHVIVAGGAVVSLAERGVL